MNALTNLASSNNLLLDAIFMYIAKLDLIEDSVILSVLTAILHRVFSKTFSFYHAFM